MVKDTHKYDLTSQDNSTYANNIVKIILGWLQSISKEYHMPVGWGLRSDSLYINDINFCR